MVFLQVLSRLNIPIGDIAVLGEWTDWNAMLGYLRKQRPGELLAGERCAVVRGVLCCA